MLTELLGEDTPCNSKNTNDQLLLDPSHPLHNALSTLLLRRMIEQTQEEPRKRPRTLADEAESKLKKLTGQDFGKDARAWREWVDSNFAKPTPQ